MQSAGGVSEYSYQGEVTRALASMSADKVDVLNELKVDGSHRIDFCLTIKGQRHILELLLLDNELADHGQRAEYQYREAVAANSSVCMVFSRTAPPPNKFITYKEIPVVYVWPDTLFSCLHVAYPRGWDKELDAQDDKEAAEAAKKASS
jgi:hypothetical protein